MIHRIITSVKWGDGAALRPWLRDNIGEAYTDWETFPLVNGDDDIIGVKVYTDEHAVLVKLRWS